MNDDDHAEHHGDSWRLLDSRAHCRAAIRELLAEAATRGCRELWLCDTEYLDWPLGERDVIDSLSRWALPHRRLTLLASSFEAIAQRHPRWVDWRRAWSHVVECRLLDDIEPDRVPGLLLASGIAALRIADRVHGRGSLSHEAADLVRCREAVDALMQRSVESFPPTALGL
ncbi:MAG: hypothetical protein ACM3N6_07885 [Betaproteobacteria bacterium]